MATRGYVRGKNRCFGRICGESIERWRGELDVMSCGIFFARGITRKFGCAEGGVHDFCDLVGPVSNRLSEPS